MKPHVEVYLKHFDIGIEDIWNCEMCGRSFYIQNMDIHHIKPRSKGLDNSISNLAALCRDCHYKVHNSGVEFKLSQSRINRE